MQAQQVLSLPRRSISTMIAVVATMIAAVLALALVYGMERPTTQAPTTVVTLHGAGAEQVSHNRAEEGIGVPRSVGGDQIAHDRSEQGLDSI